MRQITYEEMKEYGEFFRHVRQSIGYTIKQMAAEIGIFHTTLYRWEKGLIIPQQDIFELEQKYRALAKGKA